MYWIVLIKPEVRCIIPLTWHIETKIFAHIATNSWSCLSPSVEKWELWWSIFKTKHCRCINRISCFYPFCGPVQYNIFVYGFMFPYKPWYKYLSAEMKINSALLQYNYIKLQNTTILIHILALFCTKKC